ncbi:MAG: hypothetical protein ACTHJW_19145 [Streptosporangiaceae bacterium]
MKLTFDADADAAFFTFGEAISPGGAPRSEICNLEMKDAAVILLFSPGDWLVGLEILGASRVLTPEVLAEASRS